jgi:hypothetical protein
MRLPIDLMSDVDKRALRARYPRWRVQFDMTVSVTYADGTSDDYATSYHPTEQAARHGAAYNLNDARQTARERSTRVTEWSVTMREC